VGSFRQTKARLEEWRDAQPLSQKGCGCIGLLALGVLCFAFMGGAMMGDYMGPPEGAAEDARTKGIVIVLSLVGIVACGVVGAGLMAKRPE
jgi:ABC-type arginine transport system permease subunit